MLITNLCKGLICQEAVLEIRLTEKAVKDQVLRIWLRRIPEESGILHAYKVKRTEPDQLVGTTTLYGRGPGSSAQERAMLIFRLAPPSASVRLLVGDLIEVRIEAEDGLRAVEFDILEIE